MANRDIVAIGTSAGGFEALRFLAKGFDRDFPASILITIHLHHEFRSELDQLLSAAGHLTATFATDGEVRKNGRIYIAPPGRHLLVDQERLWLGVGPRENHACPAIDPMLRSIAVCCGYRAIGVVLTGTLGDGASGLAAIEHTGGVAVVQNPKDAAFPEMPENAIRRDDPDHVVDLREMPALLDKLVRQPAGDPVAPPDKLRYEVEIARNGRASMEKMDWLGQRSVLTCPDCGGIMWEIKDGELSRYRCHIGHAYTQETITAGVDERLKRALASALRALNERVGLVAKLRDEAGEKGRPNLVEKWSAQAREFEREADVIRDAIGRLEGAERGEFEPRISNPDQPGASRVSLPSMRRSKV
jgi:two-component system, chemotaxis family, protein-glutamate methylesterase/glutaminase